MHQYSIDVYIFGETHNVTFMAKESKEELEEDYKLLYKYVNEAVLNELDIENDTLKQY